MPKIRIREKDLTTNPIVGETTNYILYVLGSENFSTLSTKAESEEENTVLKTLVADLNVAPRTITAEEASAVVVALGNKDYFLTEAITLGGLIVLAKDWDSAQAYCGDRNQYDIKFILANAKSTDTESEGDLAEAKAIVETRKDCAIVLTIPQPEEGEVAWPGDDETICKSTCGYITSGGDMSNPSAKNDQAFFEEEEKKAFGKYVLPFYAPNIHKATNTSITLTAGEAYLLAYLNSANSGVPEWFAMAGATRGEIPNGYEIDGFLKESDIDNMQLRVYDADHLVAINPICNMNPWGTRIWGNRTALPNDNVEDTSSLTDQLVASSFANIRVLLCDIKKQMYKSSRQYQFEQNSDVLWVNFQSSINTLLEEMKQSGGIAAYKWVREDTPERAKLKAKLRIIPVEAVEDFDLTIELNDTLEVTEA